MAQSPPPSSQSAGIVFDGYAYKPPPSYEECMSTRPIEPPRPPPQSPRPGDGLLGELRPGQGRGIYGPDKTTTIFGNWASKNKSTICGVIGAVTIFGIFIVLAYIIISTANAKLTNDQNRVIADFSRETHSFDRMTGHESNPQMTHDVPVTPIRRFDAKDVERLRLQMEKWNVHSEFLQLFESAEKNSKDKKENVNIHEFAISLNNDVTTDSDTYSSEDDDQDIEEVQQQLKNWNFKPFFLNLFRNKTDNKRENESDEEITTILDDNVNSPETNLNTIKTGE